MAVKVKRISGRKKAYYRVGKGCSLGKLDPVHNRFSSPIPVFELNITSDTIGVYYIPASDFLFLSNLNLHHITNPELKDSFFNPMPLAMPLNPEQAEIAEKIKDLGPLWTEGFFSVPR